MSHFDNNDPTDQPTEQPEYRQPGDDISQTILAELEKIYSYAQKQSEHSQALETRIFGLEQYAVSLQNLLKNPDFLRSIGELAIQQASPTTNLQGTPQALPVNNLQATLQNWAALGLKAMELTRGQSSPAPSPSDSMTNSIKLVVDMFKGFNELQKVAISGIKEMSRDIRPTTVYRKVKVKPQHNRLLHDEFVVVEEKPTEEEFTH